MNNQKGFTLLEILVVLTIMGFLIAMVAPRLAGITGGAVDQVCDTNQNRMVTYMSTYYEKTGRYPSKLTNLVEQDGSSYAIPAVSDSDPDNGPETLAAEFDDRNHFKIHYLTAAEVSELADLGITKIFNLNSYDNSTVASNDQQPSMNVVNLKDSSIGDYDVAVAMVGMGVNSSGNAWVTESTERGWGEPDWFGRIVFGLGPECSLITSGVISNAAHCPGGIQNEDNCTYNDYNIVVPRLQATVDQMTAITSGLVPDGDTSEDGIQLVCVSYDDAPASNYDVTANDENLRKRSFTITEAQESWQFATQCPEGHMYPEDDGEFWGIANLNAAGDTTLN